MVALSVVPIGEDMAARVVLLASSGARCEHRGRVALSVVTGRVRLLLSSRAGLAHCDCSPQCRPPNQSPFHLGSVTLHPLGGGRAVIERVALSALAELFGNGGKDKASGAGRAAASFVVWPRED